MCYETLVDYAAAYMALSQHGTLKIAPQDKNRMHDILATHSHPGFGKPIDIGDICAISQASAAE